MTKTEIHATFHPLIASTGAQNRSTVTTANGTAEYCINGIRRPRLFLLLSESDAIQGSVTASKIRLIAVIRPRMVKNPPMIRPGVM